MLVNHSVSSLDQYYRRFTSMIQQYSIYHTFALHHVNIGSDNDVLNLKPAQGLCSKHYWGFSSRHMQDGANFTFDLKQIFWFYCCWFQKAEKKIMFWLEKSHLPFCSTVVVHKTGTFDRDNSKLQGHLPRLKCSVLLCGGTQCCKKKICTMENVFLMCFWEWLSAFHVHLRCFPAP